VALLLLRLPLFRSRAHRLSRRPGGAQIRRSACVHATMRS